MPTLNPLMLPLSCDTAQQTPCEVRMRLPYPLSPPADQALADLKSVLAAQRSAYSERRHRLLLASRQGMRAIVKIQALFRGYRVRAGKSCSSLAIEQISPVTGKAALLSPPGLPNFADSMLLHNQDSLDVIADPSASSGTTVEVPPAPWSGQAIVPIDHVASSSRPRTDAAGRPDAWNNLLRWAESPPQWASDVQSSLKPDPQLPIIADQLSASTVHPLPTKSAAGALTVHP
eukprot:gene3676-4099_t